MAQMQSQYDFLQVWAKSLWTTFKTIYETILALEACQPLLERWYSRKKSMIFESFWEYQMEWFSAVAISLLSHVDSNWHILLWYPTGPDRVWVDSLPLFTHMPSGPVGYHNKMCQLESTCDRRLIAALWKALHSFLLRLCRTANLLLSKI